MELDDRRVRLTRVKLLGLLQALLFAEPVAERVCVAAREAGLLVNAARPNVLRFMPQLRISELELDELFASLEAARAALLA